MFICSTRENIGNLEILIRIKVAIAIYSATYDQVYTQNKNIKLITFLYIEWFFVASIV